MCNFFRPISVVVITLDFLSDNTSSNLVWVTSCLSYFYLACKSKTIRQTIILKINIMATNLEIQIKRIIPKERIWAVINSVNVNNLLLHNDKLHNQDLCKITINIEYKDRSLNEILGQCSYILNNNNQLSSENKDYLIGIQSLKHSNKIKFSHGATLRKIEKDYNINLGIGEKMDIFIHEYPIKIF